MDKKRIGPVRVVIYIKDVMLITGKKLTAARTLYHSILEAFQKQPGQMITLREFCMYTGIDEEEARALL